MDGRGEMDWRIKPLDPANAAFVCPALTAFAYPADVVGDLVIGMMRNKGIAAFRGPAAVLRPQRDPCTAVAQADGGQALARRRRTCSARVSWSGMPPALPWPALRGHGRLELAVIRRYLRSAGAALTAR
jgi:hypothetical protein